MHSLFDGFVLILLMVHCASFKCCECIHPNFGMFEIGGEPYRIWHTVTQTKVFCFCDRYVKMLNVLWPQKRWGWFEIYCKSIDWPRPYMGWFNHLANGRNCVKRVCVCVNVWVCVLLLLAKHIRQIKSYYLGVFMSYEFV